MANPLNNSSSDRLSDDDEKEDKRAQQQRVLKLWQERNKKQRPAKGGPLRFKTLFRNTIFDVMRSRGWIETQSETEWDMHWCGKEWIRTVLDKIHLDSSQRVNHHRNFYELTRKDLLIKNLKKAKRALQKQGRSIEAERDYAFYPETYSLPNEYSLFVEAFKRINERNATAAAAAASAAQQQQQVVNSTTAAAAQSPHHSQSPHHQSQSPPHSQQQQQQQNAVWIMKPIGSSQGKGIFLFDKLQSIAEWKTDYQKNRSMPSQQRTIQQQQQQQQQQQSFIQQQQQQASSSLSSTNRDGSGTPNEETVDMGAEKYIVQQYIHNPLLIGGKKFDMRIYVLVTSYNPLLVYLHRDGFARFSSQRFSSLRCDLTDSFVHLTNVAIQKKGDAYDSESGGKWEIRSLKTYLISLYGAARVNTLFLDIERMIVFSLLSVAPIMINDRQSHAMYGYDCLVDSNLKPWLIEVNASPSLTANTESDYALKFALLHDTMTVVDLERRFTPVFTDSSVEGHVVAEQVGGYDLIFHKGQFVHQPQAMQPVASAQSSQQQSVFNSSSTKRERESAAQTAAAVAAANAVAAQQQAAAPQLYTATLGMKNERTQVYRKMWRQIAKHQQQQTQQTQQPSTSFGSASTASASQDAAISLHQSLPIAASFSSQLQTDKDSFRDANKSSRESRASDNASNASSTSALLERRDRERDRDSRR